MDLGSSTTVCNWAAAAAIGLGREGDARVRQTDNVVAGQTGDPVRLHEATAWIDFAAGNLLLRSIDDSDAKPILVVQISAPESCW